VIVRVILASVQRVAVRNARPITNVAEWYSDLSFHFAGDQADLQKMTYNARTGERTAQNRSQRSTTGSQPRTHDLGPQHQSHRHGQPRSDSPPSPACMAPNDDWSHICARSGLGRLLGVFVDCLCELCISKTVGPYDSVIPAA